MATAQGVNVLRYSALVFGVLYGFQHQRTITSNARAAHAKAEYQHKEDLIQKAKLEWAKKSLPPEKKTPGGDSWSTSSLSHEDANCPTSNYGPGRQKLRPGSISDEDIGRKLSACEHMLDRVKEQNGGPRAMHR